MNACILTRKYGNKTRDWFLKSTNASRFAGWFHLEMICYVWCQKVCDRRNEGYVRDQVVFGDK